MTCDSQKLQRRLPKLTSVLLTITEECHVGCRHCGFIGSSRDREAEPDEMSRWVAEACEYGVPELIFTGGEPFLRLEALEHGVRAAAQAGKQSGIFTSSVWATNLTVTRDILIRLSGVTHLYLSSDVYHQERIPVENVRRVIDVAFELGVPKITICITYTKTDDLLHIRSMYEQYGQRLTFHQDRVIPTKYLRPRLLKNQNALLPPDPSKYDQHCYLSTPIINPNGDLISCHAGKAGAHRSLTETPYYLGNLRNQSFREIMEKSRNRWDYQYLRTHGPQGVAQLYVNHQDLIQATGRPEGFANACDMCFSTLKTSEGRAALDHQVGNPAVRNTVDAVLLFGLNEVPLAED